MKIKTFLIVIVLVMVFLFGSILGWIIKPGAKTNQPTATAAKVAVNPSAKEIKKADVPITVQSQGRLTGSAMLVKRTTTAKTGSTREVATHPEPELTASTAGLPPGDLVTVPVSGAITAKYANAKTGEQIGEDTRALTGQTTVWVTDDQLKVDTKFDDQVTFAVNVPEPKKLKNEAGYFYDGDQQVYYKRNLITVGKKIELSGYVGGTLNIDDVDESRVEAGIRVRW
jgi:hypothetical protein